MITMQEASEKLLEIFQNTNSPHVVQNRMGTAFFLVIQEGFEPPTHGLEGRCSIQLSYWTIWCLRRAGNFYCTTYCTIPYWTDKRSLQIDIVHIMFL